ncbi:MAG TPA: hypothetical protein VHC47_01080 [Mucilaginibacter sp.]|nr:hypothetical protein [Mucilaginibacter sp.]
MKKIVLAVSLLLTCFLVHAQTLSFGDLLNLTSMNDAQAHDFLTTTKGFMASGTQMLNGRNYELYKLTKADPGKFESVLVGAGAKNTSGDMAHEIIYNATAEQDLENLLAQAKKSTMTLIFQGADQNSNIYRFDNSLFRASISLAFDKKSGNVDVQQK